MEIFLTVVILIIVFFWILSKALPFLLKAWIRRRFGHFEETPRGKEGDVFVEHSEKQEKVIDKNVGEYVDFEEKN